VMVEGFELDPAVEIELNAARSLGRDAPDLPRRLDVLPVSSRLAARDGVPVPKFESVHIAHLARAPIDAVLEPVERRGTASPGRPGDLESCATAQRAMTAAERAELIKLRRRLMAAWVWLPLPLAFITLGAL